METTMVFRFCRVALVLLVFVPGAFAARADEALFIGNSFTFGATVPGLAEKGGVPKMVEAIARSKGINLTADSVTSPGKDWSWHLAQPATATALTSKTWDWLVLQDFSTRPTRMGNVAQFMQDGVTLSDDLAQHAPQAGIVLYETWPRPAGTFYQTAGGRKFSGPADMMADLHDSYAKLAAKLAALNPARPVRVAPVGTAMARCKAEYPDIPLDAADHHHATAQGYYLAAMVIFETIYHQAADDVPINFFDGVVMIPQDEALKLQLVADEVAGPQSPVPPGKRARHITPGPPAPWPQVIENSNVGR
jgi:hypothetical protein